ncbi:MAG: hypothetical protein ACR2G3_01380 [Solirubrobacterales bacterium]
MHRYIAIGAAATALLWPPAAEAQSSSGEVAGPATGGFEVILDVRYRNGKPKVVEAFKFRRVAMTCVVGAPFRTKSTAPFGPMLVNREWRFGRVFTNDGNNFDGATVIRGEFATKKRVSGTLKITGDYPNAGYEGCTSGRLEWSVTLD